MEEEKQREQELLWKEEMLTKLRKQQESERRQREMGGARPFGTGDHSAGTSQGSGYLPWEHSLPPPPKLSGAYSHTPDNRSKSEAQGFGGFRRSDVFGDKIPFKSGSVEKSGQDQDDYWRQYARKVSDEHEARGSSLRWPPYKNFYGRNLRKFIIS